MYVAWLTISSQFTYNLQRQQHPAKLLKIYNAYPKYLQLNKYTTWIKKSMYLPKTYTSQQITYHPAKFNALLTIFSAKSSTSGQCSFKTTDTYQFFNSTNKLRCHATKTLFLRHLKTLQFIKWPLLCEKFRYICFLWFLQKFRYVCELKRQLQKKTFWKKKNRLAKKFEKSGKFQCQKDFVDKRIWELKNDLQNRDFWTCKNEIQISINDC
jgi:hypothetical protein